MGVFIDAEFKFDGAEMTLGWNKKNDSGFFEKTILDVEPQLNPKFDVKIMVLEPQILILANNFRNEICSQNYFKFKWKNRNLDISKIWHNSCSISS